MCTELILPELSLCKRVKVLVEDGAKEFVKVGCNNVRVEFEFVLFNRGVVEHDDRLGFEFKDVTLTPR